MSYLIRDGMHPITEGFAEAWREYSDSEIKAKPLDGYGVTEDEFKQALDALGLSDAKALGELWGVGPDRARQIRRRPWTILPHQLEALRCAYVNRARELYHDLKTFEDLEEQIPGSYAEEAEGANSELKALLKACQPLFADENFKSDYFTSAVRREFEARALVEGYNTLSAEDKRVLLRTLEGLLLSGGGLRNRFIALQLAKTSRLILFAGDLVEMIASDELDQYLSSTDENTRHEVERGVIDEYAGGDQSA